MHWIDIKVNHYGKEELWIYFTQKLSRHTLNSIISSYNAPLLDGDDGISIAKAIVTVLEWYSGKGTQQWKKTDEMEQI